MQYAKSLRYIDAIARAGSIRSAADRLNIASSALNRRLLELEREIGSSLFERLTRGVRLTAAGEVFVAHIRNILSDLDRTHSQLDELRGLRRGTVRVAAIEAMASEVLPKTIAEFSGRYPRVQFRVSILGREQVVNAVMSYDADIGVVFNPTRHRGFQSILEVDQVLHAIVRDDHPLAARKSVRLQDCLDYPIALADESLGGRSMLDEFMASRSLSIRPVLEANSFELMREFVQISKGVCFQIAVGTRRGSDRKGFVAVPVIERGFPRRKLIIGVVKDRVLPVPAALYSEALRAYLRVH